ncbi:serine hydrolase-like protein 2 [Hyposmocoma kahamanoa]|uniref:serine hydrolase-like protein 2 n=1 Tax=Hyposmocoma kahamanoa TaxID=1477025 RepID=UPI000E6D84A9|nr:serine hydrolase-like protein 2 [Hyposmocoma kahamanoa]
MASTLLRSEKEIFINAPWGKIAALTWGDHSNPPIILCHGKMDTSSGFRPLVSLLPPSFFYVSVDLPGNGHSDHFPPEGRFTVVDFVPTIHYVQEHFKWKKFAYIGHSLGVIIGKYFNIAYPGCISRMVELDPVPAHESWSVDNFGHWYHIFYGDYYNSERYKKQTAKVDTAPKYTYEKAKDLMMNTRSLTEEAAKHVLERALTPVGDGLYRFTYDQRLKEIPRMPWTPEFLKELYTSVETPTFTVLAKSIVEMGAYHFTPFLFNEAEWPNKNYRYIN